MFSATYHTKPPSSISGDVGGKSLKQKKAATTQHTEGTKARKPSTTHSGIVQN